MAVFRIEKTQNYTVMSNHHLRNAALSLKAKGLLSQILSLPENWDYTLAGLSHINRESVDAIRTAIHELERTGYITRSRERKDNGQLGGAEYVIHEQPQEPDAPDGDHSLPISDPPTQKKPISENPIQVTSTLEKSTQLNKDILNTKKSITDLSNTHSIPILSPDPFTYGEEIAATPPERKGTEASKMRAFDVYEDIIKEHISYDNLIGAFDFQQAALQAQQTKKDKTTAKMGAA